MDRLLRVLSWLLIVAGAATMIYGGLRGNPLGWIAGVTMLVFGQQERFRRTTVELKRRMAALEAELRP